MTRKPQPGFETIEQSIAGDALTSDEPYQNLLELCDVIGSRFAGSEGEHRAAHFLRQKLEEYGLCDAHLEEFRYTGWQRGETCFEILAPKRLSVAALALPYSPMSDIVGDIISIGEGEKEDFTRLGDSIRGKITLCQAEGPASSARRPSHRREKYQRAVEAGATGFLYASRNPGHQLVTGGLAPGRPASIPGLAISSEDSATLIRYLGKGDVKAHVKVSAVFSPVVSYNVVADVPGRDLTRHVLVGGHYDSHDVAVGAIDNASGTAVALEVGRLLVKNRSHLDASVRITCFAAEEVGLLGSWEYTRRHSDVLDGLLFMLNLDSVSGGQVGDENLYLMGSANLTEYFVGVAQSMAYPLQVQSRPSANSDHFPFAISGIPTGGLAPGFRASSLVGRGWGHTCSDTVDKVQPLTLRTFSMLTARLALRIANDQQWPGCRSDRDRTQKLIEDEGLGGYLQQVDRYPA